MYEIPPRIRITSKVTYEVRWTDEFKDPDQLGECCPSTKQIVIKTGLKKRKAFYVFLHEVLHAISLEHELELTEAQVEGLELGLDRLARLNRGMKLF